MKIAIIADDKKKELIAEFCIAYCGILSKHSICATSITGKYMFFRDTTPEGYYNTSDTEVLRMCDIYNIPAATNIATAEVLVRALDRGDFDWRNYGDL